MAEYCPRCSNKLDIDPENPNEGYCDRCSETHFIPPGFVNIVPKKDHKSVGDTILDRVKAQLKKDKEESD